MKNPNTLCVDPCKLDEIVTRICVAHATLDLIHDAVTENPASDALYGLMFTLDAIRADIEALTT